MLPACRSMLARLGRFGALGIASFGLNIGITVVLTEIVGIFEEFSFAIALAVTLVFNFVNARNFVFSNATDGNLRRQIVKYGVAVVLFRGVEFLGFLVLHTWLDLPYIAAAVLVLGVSFLTKFATYNTVVFTPDGGSE